MPHKQKELLANIAPFGLRMQPDLKEKIKWMAQENGRSMNAEIVARLEASFTPEQYMTKKEVEDVIDSTIEALIKNGWRKKDE